MKKITLVALFLLFNFNLFAQFKPTKLSGLEDSYTNYFKLNREIIYLHLNKTSVIKKEDLWVSAYIYNPVSNTPNSETVNLNLEIFDESGKFLESQTVIMASGKGSFYINLNKEMYGEGKYFIKASTKYMENFKEDLSYVQNFQILGATTEEVSSEKKSFDLQLLPEGGYILADVWNNVGVKLIDSNGISVVFTEGKLMDSDGTVISSFKSNQFGLSKFNFMPIPQQIYSIEVSSIDGEIIKATLPKSELKGFNISGNNLKDQLIVTINTNTASQDLVKDKIFYAAIHQDGNIKDFAFQFPDDKLEASLKLSKDSLYTGINTITIFDENFNPLLERLFFNEKNLKRIRVNAQVNSAISDSVRINLKAASAIKNNSLSISVLPKGSKAYNPKHNILSAFYLKPYLNGELIQGSYYFSDGNSRKLYYDLDLLLLTQGWSKFKWSAIYNNTPKELIDAERGFTITGKIIRRNDKKENTVFIKSEETGLFEIVQVQDDDSFILKNIYVLDSSALSYGLMNEKNSKISKPDITAKILPNKDSEASLSKKIKFHKPVSDFIPSNLFEDLIRDAESLDTVILKVFKKEFEIPRSEVKATDTFVEVTDEVSQRYLYVTDYLTQNGFLVYYDDRNQLVIKNRLSSGLDGSLLTPLIYFNDHPTENNVSQLEYLLMSELENIVINKMGSGYGMRGMGGVIKVKTRNKPRNQIFRETIKEIITNNGFTKEKEFYAPKYTSYSNDAFKNYGVIGWISDISIRDNRTASFKILNTMQPQVTLFIEGMTVDGNLISETIQVQTQ